MGRLRAVPWHGAHLRLLGAWLAALALTMAVAQTVSEPPVVLPALPDANAAQLEIPDLDEAPPIARDPIVELALLGAYPLGPDMFAFPNRVLTNLDAAFMLVNLFSLRLVDEFPVPADEALTYLQVIAETQVPGEEAVTVGALRDYLLVFVDLASFDPADVARALGERYPALAAGNPEVPVTRAGAALMIVIALEHIRSLQP